MTTLTSPHDLLSAIPFIVGYHPADSIFILTIKNHHACNALRLEMSDAMELDQLDAVATHLRDEAAEEVMIVAYLPAEYGDGEHLLAPLQEMIEISGVKVKEVLVVKKGRWRSLICQDEECCPPNGNLVPPISESKVAAERVAAGAPLPLADAQALVNSIAALPVSDDLKSAILRVPVAATDDEEANLALAKSGALAVNQIVEAFAEFGICDDLDLVATVLVRLLDLQVRDYAMGLSTQENRETLFALWRWLLRLAPVGLVAPVGVLLSVVAYERGDTELAHRALDRSLADDDGYGLARLLRRAFTTGWPKEMFDSMRQELHPKVSARIFGDVAPAA